MTCRAGGQARAVRRRLLSRVNRPGIGSADVSESAGRPTTSHWGAFTVRAEPGGGVEVTPHPDDPAPSPLLGNVPGGLRHATRVARPAIRRDGCATGRGRATGAAVTRSSRSNGTPRSDLLAAELARVRAQAGNEADLRRVVRLGQRRAVPPRAEPAAPVPRPVRRLHVLAQHLQLRHLAGAAAASGRRREPGTARSVLVADDRGEHRADRGVRRHPGEERVRHPGRGDPARHARASRPTGRPGHRDRAGQPAALATCPGTWTRSGIRSSRAPTSR